MSLVRDSEFNCYNVKVFVGDKEIQPFDDMLINVPSIYCWLFNGKRFKDKESFNRALMFAGCAQEGYFTGGTYGRYVQHYNEMVMENCLKACV